MNRTFLLWQEADISKVGGQSQEKDILVRNRVLVG